ncbi:hypothetical protein KP014_16285 [Paenibacillus sophorae]|uniref:Uncharacterized protein n=1 Tax=Paenibacillus sophorae TaxID=1333845 RepID=A0ABX8H938_9BACL|nr:hypothetical protein KP014_16285 [Paenibacillus sophorae]
MSLQILQRIIHHNRRLGPSQLASRIEFPVFIQRVDLVDEGTLMPPWYENVRRKAARWYIPPNYSYG